jgi:predicted permease
MDLTKLSLGDKVIAGSGIALFIFSFLPWFGVEGASNNALDYFFAGVIPLLIAIAMVVQVVLAKLAGVEMPTLGSLTYGQLDLILGSIAAALVVIKLLAGSSAGNEFVSVSLDRKFGIFLAAIAAIGLAVGGFLAMQEDKAGGGAPPPPAA